MNVDFYQGFRRIPQVRLIRQKEMDEITSLFVNFQSKSVKIFTIFQNQLWSLRMREEHS